MSSEWIFDGIEQRRIHESRRDFLAALLKSIPARARFNTALDAGCGIGFFAGFLCTEGFDVTAYDAREENVAEAKLRYPNVKFCIQNAEDANVLKLGNFDLTVCFGLLYHLENPFSAIRNLYALTRQALIIESMIAPNELPIARLLNECEGMDQGVRYVAFIPSESCLVKMLYLSGFSFVYLAAELPDHEDFRESETLQRRRTIIVASKNEIFSPMLRRVHEPYRNTCDIWQKESVPLVKSIWRFIYNLPCRIRKKLTTIRKAIPHPVRLSYGVWWLAYNDILGLNLRQNENFEIFETKFIKRFLKAGMVFLDAGANQGFYTMLASKLVGPTGKVFAFEPSPREFARLRRHLWLNRCRNVVAEQIALGSQQGTSELYVCMDQETGCNSLRLPAVNESVQKTMVSVHALDNYLSRCSCQAVDFIKLDVEGAELDTLKGAMVLLGRKPRPVILVELADIRTEPCGYSAVQVYDFLSSMGYRWFSILPEGTIAPCERREKFCDNLLAVPAERLDAIFNK